MALTHAALAGAETEGSLPGGLFGGDPTVRVGRRFLPVAAAALPPVADRDGLVALPLAPGTPVHAMEAGRVVSAEGATAGEVTIRIESETRLVYRKLLPSSVTVTAGDTVSAGDVIGVVAPGAGDRLVTLELGVQNPDGSWEKLSSWLTGLPDPLELYLRPPGAPRPAEPSQPTAAAARSAGFTVVKAQPNGPEPQPEPEPQPQPDEPRVGEPERVAPAPEISVSASGPETTELESARPGPAGPGSGPEPPDEGPEPRHAATQAEPEDLEPAVAPPRHLATEPPRAEPAEKATGASALTSRRRRGRPGQPEPEPLHEAGEPAPAAERTPQEPGPAPEPVVTPEPVGATSQQELGGVEPEAPEQAPEVTISVPEPAQTEPATDAGPGQDAADETETAGESTRATQASRLTSRRQRPKRSRP